MANFKMTTMLAALLAGSLAVTAGGVAFADNVKTFDPAKFNQHIEKRVDRALTGTDATADQKKKVSTIIEQAFTDMKPLHDKRVENRRAMADAMQAPTIDKAKIEALRQEQMKTADAGSKRFTQALTDAGDVLSVQQRQAFFKKWSERGEHGHHGKRG
ncbi:MAG: periplasmic heavy metal sensor [Enhydrobacter sp.]